MTALPIDVDECPAHPDECCNCPPAIERPAPAVRRPSGRLYRPRKPAVEIEYVDELSGLLVICVLRTHSTELAGRLVRPDRLAGISPPRLGWVQRAQKDYAAFYLETDGHTGVPAVIYTELPEGDTPA